MGRVSGEFIILQNHRIRLSDISYYKDYLNPNRAYNDQIHVGLRGSRDILSFYYDSKIGEDKEWKEDVDLLDKTLLGKTEEEERLLS